MPFKADDYRRQAEECFESAKRARKPAAKARYIELVRKWLALAERIDLEGNVDDRALGNRRR